MQTTYNNFALCLHITYLYDYPKCVHDLSDHLAHHISLSIHMINKRMKLSIVQYVHCWITAQLGNPRGAGLDEIESLYMRGCV